MARVKIPEPYRKLARLARAANWEISWTRNNHLAWRAPDGPVVYSPGTPSDWRYARNLAADLRRAGLEGA
jgi:hypothetical protein